YPLQGFFQKDRRVGAFPLWIRRRKQRAYVGSTNRAEQRIGDGVQENVSVGVAAESLVVMDRHASDLERHAGHELVGVPAESDAVGRFHLACSLRRAASS